MENLEAASAELGAEFARFESLRSRKAELLPLNGEVQRLQLALLRTQSEGAALEMDVLVPRNVHRWSLLEVVNPELLELVLIRDKLRDQLLDGIRRQDRLREEKEHLAVKVEEKSREVTAVQCEPSEVLEEIKGLECQLKGKTQKIMQLMREADDFKGSADSWHTMMRSVRADVLHEQEVFYETKMREVRLRGDPVVREPAFFGHGFYGERSPRYLQVLNSGRIGMRRRTTEPVSAGRIMARMLGQISPPVIPPLCGMKTAR
jgi:chromosome segregation ATPase